MGLLLTTQAFAGGGPKGKPFVAIDDQIIEVKGAISSLQDQIDLLVARVDTTEQRLDAVGVAVVSLQENSALLQLMVDQNATDIASINGRIAELEGNVTSLQAQISANDGDITALEAELAADQVLITNLQTALLALQAGSISADADLQGQIDNNSGLILAMESEIKSLQDGLQLKQNLVSGSCPHDEHLVAVQSDGSVVCDPDNQTSTAGLVAWDVWGPAKWVAKNVVAPAHVPHCPERTLVVGGGYYSTHPAVRVHRSAPVGNGWITEFFNQADFGATIYAIAMCAYVSN